MANWMVLIGARKSGFIHEMKVLNCKTRRHMSLNLEDILNKETCVPFHTDEEAPPHFKDSNTILASHHSDSD